MTIKPPESLVPDQRVADFYQTALMNPEGLCAVRGATMAGLMHELLWLRQLNAPEITALKVTLGAGVLLEPEEMVVSPNVPLFE